MSQRRGRGRKKADKGWSGWPSGRGGDTSTGLSAEGQEGLKGPGSSIGKSREGTGQAGGRGGSKGAGSPGSRGGNIGSGQPGGKGGSRGAGPSGGRGGGRGAGQPGGRGVSRGGPMSLSLNPARTSSQMSKLRKQLRRKLESQEGRVEGLLAGLSLLPQPLDLLPESVAEMLVTMDACVEERHTPAADHEPLLALRPGSENQQTVLRWQSIRHYCAAQLLACRYEELREVFASFDVLFSGGVGVALPPGHSRAGGTGGELSDRDIRTARINYIPAVRMGSSVQGVKSMGAVPEFSINLMAPSQPASRTLPPTALEGGFPPKGKVVCLLCRHRDGGNALLPSTRKEPQFPDRVVYAYCLNVFKKGTGHVIVVGFPSANSLRMLRDAVAVDVLFLTSTLHVTLWPKLESLARLLPIKDRPDDCRNGRLCQLPVSRLPRVMCAHLPEFACGERSDGVTTSPFAKHLDDKATLRMADAFAQQHTMDSSQTRAFKSVCSSPIVLVQGIPGAGKTYTANRAAQFRFQIAGKAARVLMGSYKNVSTDHLCEEADNAPHRVLRLGNSSQSSVLLTKDSAGDMKNNPRTHARMKELQYFTTVALNAYIFVTTTLLSDSCPVDAESQALFAPVCVLLEAVYSGDLAKLLEPGDTADTPGGIFTPQARQASEFMVEELLKDCRHEDIRRPLWELYQQSVSSTAGSREVTAHLQRAYVARRLDPNSDDEDKGNDEDGEGDEAVDEDEEMEFDALDEERIRRLEESNQEQGELMRLHLRQYGRGNDDAGLEMPRANPDANLITAAIEVEGELPHDSFVYLASASSELGRRREHVCALFTALVTEAMDTLRPMLEALSQQNQGEKFRSKFNAVGCTTSYGQMKPGVLRAMELSMYVGEEAGEVSEYQLLALLAGLHRTPFPEPDACNDEGRDKHGHLYAHSSWPQIVLLGDHQQLRPLMKAEGLQGSVFQASAFERLVHRHQAPQTDIDSEADSAADALATLALSSQRTCGKRQQPGQPLYPLVSHVNLHANRRSHPAIVGPFRCVYKVEIDSMVSPMDRLLIPEYSPSRLAHELMALALAVDPKLAPRLSTALGNALLQEARSLAGAVPDPAYGPYDSALPGAFIHGDSGELHPLPGRVLLLDTDAIGGGEGDLSFRESRKGTSRMNDGGAWLSVALAEHLTRRVGIARKDITLLSPYAAEFFIEAERLSALSLLPSKRSGRVQRALLDLRKVSRGGRGGGRGRGRGGGGQGGRGGFGDYVDPVEEKALEVKALLEKLVMDLAKGGVSQAHLLSGMRRIVRTRLESAAGAEQGKAAPMDLYTYSNAVQIGDRMQGCESEVVILNLTLTNPNGGNFMCDYRRLNVLMSRPRSSLIIIGGGAALLGRGWAGQERASPLTVLENPLEVDGLINRLGTHTLNFRAFANSAAARGWPIAVVQAGDLFTGCPRHAGECRTNLVLRARQLAAAFPDPIDPSLPPRPVPPTRPCRSLCGLRCAREKHACRHPCHVHAPFFHAFGDSDVICTERDAWPLSEVGCVHGTTVPVPCHLLEQQASFWKGELSRPGSKRWPCSQLNMCVTCASPQSCRESCSLVGRSHVCKGRVLSLVAGGLRCLIRLPCRRLTSVIVAEATAMEELEYEGRLQLDCDFVGDYKAADVTVELGRGTSGVGGDDLSGETCECALDALVGILEALSAAPSLGDSSTGWQVEVAVESGQIHLRRGQARAPGQLCLSDFGVDLTGLCLVSPTVISDFFEYNAGGSLPSPTNGGPTDFMEQRGGFSVSSHLMQITTPSHSHMGLIPLRSTSPPKARAEVQNVSALSTMRSTFATERQDGGEERAEEQRQEMREASVAVRETTRDATVIQTLPNAELTDPVSPTTAVVPTSAVVPASMPASVLVLPVEVQVPEDVSVTLCIRHIVKEVCTRHFACDVNSEPLNAPYEAQIAEAVMLHATLKLAKPSTDQHRLTDARQPNARELNDEPGAASLPEGSTVVKCMVPSPPSPFTMSPALIMATVSSRLPHHTMHMEGVNMRLACEEVDGLYYVTVEVPKSVPLCAECVRTLRAQTQILTTAGTVLQSRCATLLADADLTPLMLEQKYVWRSQRLDADLKDLARALSAYHDEVVGHVTTFTPDAIDLLERRLTMGVSTTFGEEDLGVLPACDLAALTGFGFTSKDGSSALSLAPEIQRIDLMLFSYVVRKAALPVADGATVESSAPEVYMSSYRVASLRNIFALIGNILERRLKLLSSFASLDSGTELAQPLLLITQYPVTREAELDFMQGAVEHASDLVIKYLPGRRLKAPEKARATQRVMCSVVIPIPSAEKMDDTNRTREWLNAGKARPTNPGPTNYAFLPLFKMVIGRRTHHNTSAGPGSAPRA